MQEYAQIDVASAKNSVLEQAGYTPMGYFPLPRDCWEEGFYLPLAQRLDDVEQRHALDPTVVDLMNAQRAEIDMYWRYREYFGYGMYIAKHG